MRASSPQPLSILPLALINENGKCVDIFRSAENNRLELDVGMVRKEVSDPCPSNRDAFSEMWQDTLLASVRLAHPLWISRNFVTYDQAFPMRPASRSLKQRTLYASAWTLAGYGTSLVLRLLGNLIIARLLSPDVFGVMAVCTAVQVIITLTGDIGLRQAVIRSANIRDPLFLNTAWTVQILRGLSIWIICVGTAIVLYALNSSGAIPAGSVYANEKSSISHRRDFIRNSD